MSDTKDTPTNHPPITSTSSDQAPMRCPFAHQYQGQNSKSTSNSEIQLPPTITNHGGKCPFAPNPCENIQDQDIPTEIPPEHEELKKGYTGTTCPFLETSMNVDEEEEEKQEEMEGESLAKVQNTEIPMDITSQQQEQQEIVQTTAQHVPITSFPHHGEGHSSSHVTNSHQATATMPRGCPLTAAQAKMEQAMALHQNAVSHEEKCQQLLLEAQRNLEQARLQKQNVERSVFQTAEECVDMLLLQDNPWNKMYRKLVEYKQQHGHCDVKRQLTKEEKKQYPDIALLGSWVGKNRSECGKKSKIKQVGELTQEQSCEYDDFSIEKGKVEPYKIVALTRLGFDWAPRDRLWLENYEKVKAYLRENNGKLPQRRKSDLGVWANGQIIEYNKFTAGKPAYISQKKIDLLNEIKFPWDRKENTWNERFEALEEFQQKYGHCRVTKTYEDQVLYRWVTKERIKYRNYLSEKKPCQTDEQFELLKEIGFMDGNKIPSSSNKKRKLDGNDSKEEIGKK
ncbi:hypothetical protein CTEN210_16485 [Chaetoceros tenuissimus]|uniref:Helicase-associated domain-containing protein n=1 Tax=Chaetoceros tenuissimus TaxID=426638 RepID=A0AAD3D8W9_9STRA|nr:hypothetical protein CTEN210_16485 [Chaetoceros tenuissimus]